MSQWSKRELKLGKDHGWKSKPGYQIFVADRGAVRFDFPVGWEVVPAPDAIKFYDKPPPDDDCILQFSMIRLPPDIDFSGLPVATLLADVAKEEDRRVVSRGEVISVKRPDLDLAWEETQFIDEATQRPALSRVCLARAANIQPLEPVMNLVDLSHGYSSSQTLPE